MCKLVAVVRFARIVLKFSGETKKVIKSIASFYRIEAHELSYHTNWPNVNQFSSVVTVFFTFAFLVDQFYQDQNCIKAFSFDFTASIWFERRFALTLSVNWSFMNNNVTVIRHHLARICQRRRHSQNPLNE